MMIEPLNTEQTASETETVSATYPPKPLEEENKPALNRSIMSILLYVFVFYFAFDWSILNIMLLTGVILIHELGHFIAMKAFNYKNLGIFFVPLLGAYATGTKENISQKQSIIILLAGPLPGIIIGIVIYIIGLITGNGNLFFAANMFVLMNLFNLLPVMPLDGGRIIKSLFFENNKIISKIFIILSILAICYFSLSTGVYTLLIIALFLIMNLVNQSKVNNIKKKLNEQDINLNKNYDELTDKEYWLIRDEIGEQLTYYSKYITPKNYVISSNEAQIISQVKGIIQKKQLLDIGIGGKVLVIAIWLMSFIMPAIIGFIYYISLLV